MQKVITVVNNDPKSLDELNNLIGGSWKVIDTVTAEQHVSSAMVTPYTFDSLRRDVDTLNVNHLKGDVFVYFVLERS